MDLLNYRQIETYYLSIRDDEAEQDKLSTEELQFFKSYLNLCEQHFKDSFLQFIPDRYRQLNDEYLSKSIM